MSKDVFTAVGVGADVGRVLGRLSRVVARKSTLPSLSCVKLWVDDSGSDLWAAASSLDQWYEAKLPVELQDGHPGAGCLVRIDLLSSLLAQCNGDGVEMVSADGRISLNAQGRKATIQTLPISEFPTGPAAGDPAAIGEVDGSAIAAALDRVAFAVSKDETRYILNGALFNEDGDAVVATDGRRLALAKVELPECLRDVVLPTPSLGVFSDLWSRSGFCKVFAADSGIGVRGDDEMVWTKKIEGRYPNYKQVIPAYEDFAELKMDREVFEESLRWVAAVGNATEKERGRTATLQVEGAALRVSARAVEVGESEERVPLSDPPQGAMQVAASMDFLREMSHAAGEESLVLRVDPGPDGKVSSPIVCEAEGGRFIGIVMPMRVA